MDNIPTTRRVNFVTDKSLGRDTPIFIECINTAGEEIRLVFDQELAHKFVKNLSALLSEIQKRPSQN